MGLEERSVVVEGEPEARNGRRKFLAGALAGVATLAASRPTLAQGRAKKSSREVVPVDPFAGGIGLAIAPPSVWANPTIRLVRRATLGLSDADVTAAKAMGYQGWLQYQLDFQRIDDSAVDGAVATLWPTTTQDVNTLFSISQGTVESAQQAAWVYRAALSKRQLYERMVEFWSDHFNIEFGKVGYLKVVDDREVIRKNALGRFADLVKASSKSAAMMAYLDQNVSRVGAPNQNYARELMELHTLGVNGGYTQDDVAELSRVLTGWTIQGRGTFTFNAALHDWGSKTVMGVTIPAGSPSLGADGIKEGEQIIDMLCNHPSTATFISTKLLKWLLTPEPTQAQVNTIAGVFRATGGDLRLVVRAILNQGWVATAPVKFKRPFHYLVSSLRGSNAAITNTAGINGQLVSLGQSLYDWQTPDGYPDLFEYWSGNLMPRWQFASTVASLRSGSIVVDTTPYLAGTADAAVDLMARNFFGGEMDSTTRANLLNYLKGGTFNETRVRETLSLAIASELFQWY